MAQILKDSTALLYTGDDAQGYLDIPSYSEIQMQEFVTRYWSPRQEQMFILPFWKAFRIFETSDKIALRVTNINDPATVDAEWLLYDENSPQFLQDASDPNIYYFVLEKKFFMGQGIATLRTQARVSAMYRLRTPNLHRYILCARIGKSLDETFHVFFNAADCTLKFGGIGTGGASGGAKVPSGGQ